MAVERMNCCGAYTHVYGDFGRRVHMEGCTGRVKTRPGRRVWTALERKLRLKK